MQSIAHFNTYFNFTSDLLFKLILIEEIVSNMHKNQNYFSSEILIYLYTLFFMIINLSKSVAQNAGVFMNCSDVGNSKLKGSTQFDHSQQMYTLTGSGLNMWATSDQFHFASVKMNGDFILTTFCRFEGKGVVLHRKMGLMIREALTPGSRYADAAIHGDGLTSLQFRSAENEFTSEIKAGINAPDVIQLERKGDTIVMRCAKSGDPLAETGRITQRFKEPVYVGIFVCSHDTTVTEKAKFHNFRIDVPSYWHGWSPDGKILVYCAERNGDYDVWGIPSTGGDEFQLTNSKGLDDGPEYAPDGKQIYFNSVRTGKMKIWRMNPDGTNQVQVSFGPFHDWFAHISPDGGKMVYLSYPIDVAANSHPHNKRVLLQIQQITSPETKVLAYIYGGQGTMNVPSWSPDSKMVAFVSFTYGDLEL